MKVEEIWESRVIIIYSMVLTLRQGFSCPKTHLQGHLVLHPSDSAACVNALTLLKAVRAGALVSNTGWGSVAGRLAHDLCCFHLHRAFPHRALLAWGAAKLCSRFQHWAAKFQVFSAIGEVREMWLEIWLHCVEDFEMLVFLNARLANIPGCSLLWSCSLVFCHQRN